jgi:hypothetical protein
MHINICNHLNFALCELKLTLVSTLHISMKQEGPYHILAPSSSGFNINSTTLTRTMEVTKHKYVVSISIKKNLRIAFFTP